MHCVCTQTVWSFLTLSASLVPFPGFYVPNSHTMNSEFGSPMSHSSHKSLSPFLSPPAAGTAAAREEEWGSWCWQHSGISTANPSKRSWVCRNGCRDSPKGLCWVWMLGLLIRYEFGQQYLNQHVTTLSLRGDWEAFKQRAYVYRVSLFYLSVFPIMQQILFQD